VLAVFDPEELLSKEEKFYPYMKRLRALQNRDYKDPELLKKLRSLGYVK